MLSNFKSASCFVLVRFWNYSRDYFLNCTPLGPVTNYLITESEVVTGKSQTEALPY